MTPRRDRNVREPERLVHTYADLILRVCYTYLGSTADAEDICQDTLLKLICHDRPFNDSEHERAWVIRVTSNACKNLLRRRAAHPEVELDAIAEPHAPEDLDGRELEQRNGLVLSAVMALPLPQREAVFLHYYEGFSTRTIASILETSDDAVRQRLSRARAQLRKTLKGAFDDFPA